MPHVVAIGLNLTDVLVTQTVLHRPDTLAFLRTLADQTRAMGRTATVALATAPTHVETVRRRGLRWRELPHVAEVAIRILDRAWDHAAVWVTPQSDEQG